MTEFVTRGDILEAVFNEIVYRLVLFKYQNIDAAIFAVQCSESGHWVGIDIPPFLKNDPDQLDRFVTALAENGYTLLRSPTTHNLQ
ncbi:MAG TPA: hypothetical protein VGE31_01405 [Candidatus Paceibacterota bacterium]